ncbi:hypothetical protein Tco_1356728 [Tanacetum coccineum]
MANLEFCDKHNMVAYLDKSEGSEGFHEIIDFFFASHIHYALTASPTIYTSLIKQFWQTAALCTIDDGVLGIIATIDKKVKITVSEGSVRRHIKLEDSEGIPSLPTTEIFNQLTLMGMQQHELMEYDFDATASIPITTAVLEISTANIAVSTADAEVTTSSASISTVSPLRVSTAEDISGAETQVYVRRSASKSKDKGKAIMQESEPPKKIKKRVQVQMSIDEELAKKVFEGRTS